MNKSDYVVYFLDVKRRLIGAEVSHMLKCHYGF